MRRDLFRKTAWRFRLSPRAYSGELSRLSGNDGYPLHYEALALRLARDTRLLTATREKLARNREIYPLFDGKRFARHLEVAYATMWDVWQRGEKPRSFAVVPEPSGVTRFA